MLRFRLLLLMVAIGLAALVGSSPFMGPSLNRRQVVVFSAPTLYELAVEAGRQLGGGVGVISVGSVAAARQVQLGRVPDVVISVDSELVRFLKGYRRVESLGGFRLVLVCRDQVNLSDLRGVRFGLADPNTAPIGYRAIAALYWLSVTRNAIDVNELERSLSIRFDPSTDGGEVVMGLESFSARGNFLSRDDLAGAFLLLENNAVDCIFAHSPFVVSRRLEGRYRVTEMPEDLTFLRDPPMRFVAVTELGRIEVRRFEAVVISFSEFGDSYVQALMSLDRTKFGLVG
ncbi:MAG: substrate-binding domain-containing protein [Thaumarchaeota archaeon]|nr:substrate-binding domain-containing protein [Candidatus Calditenuaceae archaeon]MDW8187647.1 substrate-binding domain-containing protein [Nitrososphaerota archaeon]